MRWPIALPLVLWPDFYSLLHKSAVASWRCGRIANTLRGVNGCDCVHFALLSYCCLRLRRATPGLPASLLVHERNPEMMKRFPFFAAAPAMALAMLLPASSALAEPSGRLGAMPDFAHSAGDRPLRREEPRVVDSGDAPAPPRLRLTPVDAPPEARGRRLSPEEYRQLRRDIDDAGREIYRHDRPDHPRRF